MKTSILAQLNQLEADRKITILYACESGSRAWGFPSPDSDYDVRILYVHPPAWYLSIDERKDTLELPISDELDISGWELRKALQIFRKSNAVIYEWLQSPIFYQEVPGFREELLARMPAFFSGRAVIHHHLGLVHRAYTEVAEQPEIKLKKYFYILRSLLSASWVREYATVPPMEFGPLTGLLEKQPELLQTIQSWQRQKAQSVEAAKVPRWDTLHHFIEVEMSACEALARTLPTYTGESEVLNQFFRKWIGIPAVQ
jgi:predicted nucleotidyltransferase